MISTSRPSKFISEIEQSGKADFYSYVPQDVASTIQIKNSKINGELQVGTRVKHSKFGMGTIRKLEGTGQEQKAEIWFDSGGPRKMLCRFANLEIYAV